MQVAELILGLQLQPATYQVDSAHVAPGAQESIHADETERTVTLFVPRSARLSPPTSPGIAQAPELASAERIAQAFHETYERLAPSHGYETRPESAVAWAAVPEQNRRLMVATARELLAAGLILPGPAA